MLSITKISNKQSTYVNSLVCNNLFMQKITLQKEKHEINYKLKRDFLLEAHLWRNP